MTAGQPHQPTPPQTDVNRHHSSSDTPTSQLRASREARKSNQTARPQRGRRRAFLPAPEKPPPAGASTLPPDRRLLQALTEAHLPGEFHYRVFVQGIRLDLYCPAARLAVQLESPRRPRPARLTEEATRQLQNLDIFLLRVPESRIESHMCEVVAVIRKACAERVGRRDRQPSPRKD